MSLLVAHSAPAAARMPVEVLVLVVGVSHPACFGYARQRFGAFGRVPAWCDHSACQERVPVLQHLLAWTKKRRGLVAGHPLARQRLFISPLLLALRGFSGWVPSCTGTNPLRGHFSSPKRLLP